jgi:hypothetical protein
MRNYILQVTLVGIAINLGVRWSLRGDLETWQMWIAWLGITAAVAAVLAYRQRMSPADAIVGYIAAMVVALIGTGMVIVIGMIAAFIAAGG